jgi:hypothetical protein
MRPRHCSREISPRRTNVTLDHTRVNRTEALGEVVRVARKVLSRSYESSARYEKLVERLRGATASFVVDATDSSGALDWRIKPIVKNFLASL